MNLFIFSAVLFVLIQIFIFNFLQHKKFGITVNVAITIAIISIVFWPAEPYLLASEDSGLSKYYKTTILVSVCLTSFAIAQQLIKRKALVVAVAILASALLTIGIDLAFSRIFLGH